MASGSPSGSATRRMPRPPPPETALTNSGNSIDCEAAINSSTDADGADEVEHRQPRGLGRRDRARLVARQLENLGARADERDASRRACRGQVGVLRKKAVAGVDGVGVGVLGRADDLVDRQVRAHRMACFADLIRLIGFQPMQRIAVLERIHRNRRDSQLIRRPKRTNRRSPRDWPPRLSRSRATLTRGATAVFKGVSTSNSRTARGSAVPAR